MISLAFRQVTRNFSFTSANHLRAKRSIKLPRHKIENVPIDKDGNPFEFKYGPRPISNYRLKLLGWRMRTLNIGCKNRPFYLLVIQRQREDKGDEYTEQLGSFDPIPNRFGEHVIGLNIDRIRYWLGKGVEATKSTRDLLGLAGILPVYPKSYLIAHRNRMQLANKEGDQNDLEVDERR